MNVDKKYCIEITIFIYNYIMVEIIPLKIENIVFGMQVDGLLLIFYHVKFMF